MKPWESDWLHKLGNEILIKCETDVTPTDPKKIELLGHDTEEKQKERMRKLKEGMKATTLRFAYGEYPWNLVSLALAFLPAGPLLDCPAILGESSPDSSH